MEFTSRPALLIIAAFFLLYWTIPVVVRREDRAWSAQKALIALFSGVMYAAWYPPGLLLLGGFVLLVRFSGAPSPSLSPLVQRLLLGARIVAALGVLFVFKYFNFFLDVFAVTGQEKTNLILPVGISFYTFTVIGYLVDVHNGVVKPVKGVVESAILVGFWPHLAAGPILRAKNMLQSMREKARLQGDDWLLAVVLIFHGAAMKLLLADNLGSYVNENLGRGISGMNGWEAAITLLGFTGQIYADFSGYSAMAIGFALLMGFRLPANFNHPYLATTLTDFWRRWHISLSNWFRDYVFIPLGGSRVPTWRVCVNLMVVFLVSGLWHGAGYGFIIWGGIHGAVLVLEKLGQDAYLKVPAPLRWLITQLIVVVAWAFFRLDHKAALELLQTIFKPAAWGPFPHESVYYSLPILAFLVVTALDHAARVVEADKQGFPRLRRRVFSPVVATVWYLAGLLLSGRPLPFIYFNF